MLEPRLYSQRLGTLTHDQLQAALTRFELGHLIAAEAAPGGLFGQIVLIEASSGAYALRGNPHEGQLVRERYVAELIHTRSTVPSPWPYRVDESTDTFGWPYAVMPRLPGVQLADGDVRMSLSDEDRAGVVVALAECLAELHTITFERHGAYDATTGRIEPGTKDYADWFDNWTRWWLEQCRAASPATTEDDVSWVEEIIADAHDALAEPFVPVLMHTDFKEGNSVAERRPDGRWQISGLFDLADAHAGDGEYDLARACCEYVLTRPKFAELYVRTYLGLRSPRPGFTARMRHYILHDRLIIWEYGQRNGVWFRPDQTLRSFAERFLEVPEL